MFPNHSGNMQTSWGVETEKKTDKYLLGQAGTQENPKFTQARDKCKVTMGVSVPERIIMEEEQERIGK